MWDTANTAFAFGYYHICDLNGDGNVDLSDFPPIGNGISLSIKVESPFIVGVNEIETIKRLHAFPNPANKFCNFDLDSTNIYGELSVFTLSGKYKSTMIVNEYNNKIDVSYYPAGMYILKYTSGNEVLSQKLVVEH